MNPEERDHLILQTGYTQSFPFWKDKSWKRYPFAYVGSEEHFTLPAAEGWHPGHESQSWTIEGHLKAEGSGKRYAFVNIYNYNTMGRLFGFHWRLLHITDISEKKLYVDRRYHFRPLADLFKPPFDIKEENLDITYRSRGRRIDRWHTKKDSSGNLVPFEYRLEASGHWKPGEQMILSVDLEALKPPLLTGGMDYKGKVTMFAQPDTFSLSFPRFKVRGTLELSGKTEHVEGIAWAGLQWAPKHFGKRNRPIRRIKHEWFNAQLSNGWDFNLWRQLDTLRDNRLMPFSGISAVFEDNTIATTNNYTLEPLSYYKNPGTVRSLIRTAPKNHYYTYAARLTIPEWDADLIISPTLQDNTIALFVEYFFGSTEITGTIRGKEVYGVGLVEATKIWYQDHELIRMMQKTLKNLPDQAFHADRKATERKLINDLEEVLTAVQVGDKSWARRLLKADLEVISDKVREEGTGVPTASLSSLYRDLMGRL